MFLRLFMAVFFLVSIKSEAATIHFYGDKPYSLNVNESFVDVHAAVNEIISNLQESKLIRISPGIKGQFFFGKGISGESDIYGHRSIKFEGVRPSDTVITDTGSYQSLQIRGKAARELFLILSSVPRNKRSVSFNQRTVRGKNVSCQQSLIDPESDLDDSCTLLIVKEN